jgi:hypothetical protein
VVVVAATVLAAATLALPAAAYYERYVESAAWGPGSFDDSAWNRLTFNAVYFVNSFGGNPKMGSPYVRPDFSTYPYIWSNTGSIFDSRTISYGAATCKANSGNNYLVYVAYCDTGN